MSGNQDISANTVGVFINRILGYAAKQFPAEQEKEGDEWLEEACTILIENHLTINRDDFQLLGERLAL